MTGRVALGVVAATALLAGCGGTSQVSGMVVGKRFIARHYDPCASWAKVCFGGWVGPYWKLEIQENADTQDNFKEVGVRKASYYACAVGGHYPDCVARS